MDLLSIDSTSEALQAVDLPLRGVISAYPAGGLSAAVTCGEGLSTGPFMVRGGVKARGHARCAGP